MAIDRALPRGSGGGGETWAGTVRLGKAGTGPRVRVIQLLAEDESILLITTLPTTSTPPELIGQLYKHR